MLRAHAFARVGAWPVSPSVGRVREIPPNVGALPYGGAVDETVLVRGGDPPEPPAAPVAEAPMPPAAEVPVNAAEEAPRGPALSPSRAADFMTCPLLYRF